MIETVLMAAVLTGALYAVRRYRRQVARCWAHAKWWERALMLMAFLPVPGPFDELLGLWVVTRVSRRIGRAL